MSISTKNQFYRFSLRTTVSRGGWCGKAFAIKQYPPDNAQSLENLFLHLRVTFAGGMSTGDKVIKRIVICSAFPAYGFPQKESWHRELILNKAATSNVVDLKIDLTSLIDKTAIDTTYVYVETANIGGSAIDDVLAGASGTINICKLDAIYTTREIR